MIKVALLLVGCFAALWGSEVNVAAAANLTYVLKPLQKAFEKAHPDIGLHFTISGSGKLAALIEHGAPYELFLSANTAYPKKLFEAGLTLTPPKVYARGSLVLLSAKERDFSKGLQVLLSKKIKKITVANPKTAPYGKAAQEALRNAHLYTEVKYKLVYAESVSQTLVYTLRAADVGFVAKSALYAPQLRGYKKGRHWIDVPSDLYTPINQGAALLTNARKNKGAQTFYAFLFSDEARAIFRRYGYGVGE